MDTYKLVLYTRLLQEENFLWRPGLGFSRLGECDSEAHDRLDEYGPEAA